MTEKNYFGLLTRNVSMFHFFWILLMARINQGATIGNWISVDMYNKFFDVEIRLKIKRKPTAKDKQLLKAETGLDLDKISEELQ